MARKNYKRKRGDRVDEKKMPNNKQGRRAAEIIDTEEAQVSKRNDARWYAQNQQLLFDAASLPYAQPLGTPVAYFDTPTIGSGKKVSDSALRVIPGIARIIFVPTIGYSNNNVSPINVAARNIYSYVRHVNSGHANYDAPDLMMYLMAMDSALMYHSMLRRVYGVAQLYTPMNRYYPRTLVAAMGFDPEDVFANLAQLRYAINIMAVKLGSLCVPNSMAYFARHSWMCEGLYTDSDSVKAQTYFYMPYGYYQYDPVKLAETQTMNLLVRNPYGASWKVQEAIDFFNDLVNPMFQDEDFNIMSGDILKAFGEAGVIKVPSIDENYMVLPSYNLEVLSQIQNINTFGQIAPECLAISYHIASPGTPLIQRIYGSQFNNQVLQRTGPLYATSIAGHIPNFGFDGPHLITMYKDVVTPDDTMVATRCHVAGGYTKVSDTETVPELYAFGSEVILGIDIISNDNTSTLNSVTYTTGMFVDTTNADSFYSQVFNTVLATGKLSQFDYHPLILPIVRKDTDTWETPAYTLDVNNFTTIDLNSLKRMHEVAMLSLFDVPQMAFNK